MAGKRRIDPLGLTALVDQGLGCRQIARVFSVTPRAVINAAHKWDVRLQGPPPRTPGGYTERAEAAHQRALVVGCARGRPKVDAADLARLIADGLRIAELERALNVHRATLHRAAKRAGLTLPKPLHLSREDWKVLIVEHGLSVPALAKATGRRRSDVRRKLVDHGLLQTWWGRRGKRYAEWTMGEDDE
jgi:transposase